MEKEKKHHISIRFSAGTVEETTRICEMFDMKLADLFRYSLLLMRIYVNAVRDGKQLRLVDPEKPDDVYVIVLPLFAGKATEGAKWLFGKKEKAK